MTRTEMAAAAETADVIELRLDFATDFDLKAILEKRPKPVIVTHRPVREGGHYRGSEEDRLAVLRRAVELGAEYVDVELDSVGRVPPGGSTRRIVSTHNFKEVPADLPGLHAKLVKSGADIAKFACMANDIADNLRVFDVLRDAKHPTIALCMGEPGLISRILGRKYGNLLTFASLAEGKESAPGQISAADLRTLYRYKSVGPATKVYGVVANPVAHSMSPAIMNAAFDAAGLDAVYVPFKVEGDVVQFVNAFKALDVRGYSVTLPHKQAVLAAMDEVDPLAERIGAVNTVVNREGELFGTNTDVPGALKALENALRPRDTSDAGAGEASSPIRGKRVLLLGAGGAARALAYGLADRGATITIANRTHERAVKLAAEVGAETAPLADVKSVQPDVLVNTTSVGMTPNVEASPVPPGTIQPGTVIFDAVYNPPATKLLRDAQAAGCATVSGIAWFVNQAALQFELWTGLPAPRDAMERVLRQRLGIGG